MKKIAPIHPGEILLEEFLNPMEFKDNLFQRIGIVEPETVRPAASQAILWAWPRI